MILKNFYESNKDFRDYVDRYCKGKFTVEEALKHIQVRLVAVYYREVEEEKKNILVDVKEQGMQIKCIRTMITVFEVFLLVIQIIFNVSWMIIPIFMLAAINLLLDRH